MLNQGYIFWSHGTARGFLSIKKAKGGGAFRFLAQLIYVDRLGN